MRLKHNLPIVKFLAEKGIKGNFQNFNPNSHLIFNVCVDLKLKSVGSNISRSPAFTSIFFNLYT